MKHGGIMLLQIVVTAAAFGMSFAIRKGEHKSPTDRALRPVRSILSAKVAS
jgi:hypothetical protein